MAMDSPKFFSGVWAWMLKRTKARPLVISA